MRYEAEIRVFDMLDCINVSTRIWATDGLSQAAPEVVFIEARLLRGKGVDDFRQWLADALCPLVEDLWQHEAPGGEAGASC